MTRESPDGGSMPVGAGLTSAGEQSFAARVRAVRPTGRPVYVLAPPPALLAELTIATFRDPPVTASVGDPIRVVATPETLDSLFEAFRPGHQAAELHSRDLLTYRTADSVPLSGPLVVAGDTAATVVSFGRTYGLFDADSASLASLGTERAAALWERADPVDPPERPEWRAVTVSLADRTSQETLAAFVELLDARREAPPAETLDLPTLAVLAGSASQSLQKAVVAWCESQSVAAASTVSTRKSALEAGGIVTVTRDPPDGVGAPGHRLMLADDHLAALSPAELYDVAASVIES